MKNYGKTEEESHYEKMGECREIVKEILNFGVTEKQKSQIMFVEVKSLTITHRADFKHSLRC